MVKPAYFKGSSDRKLTDGLVKLLDALEIKRYINLQGDRPVFSWSHIIVVGGWKYRSVKTLFVTKTVSLTM